MTHEDLISKILNRGVAEVVVREELEKKLKSGKKLRIKLGIDPTGYDLTLGHAVVLRKLKQYQDAGHQIVLLFGTFTARIGDPTGKSQTRKPLTEAEILDNSKTYIDQAAKVIDINNIEVVYNGDWLKPMSFEDVLKLAGNFTVAQMLERDMFQERIKAGREINMVEFMYPLMQGYDSVPIKADVELGGTDQLFNMMCARPIQKNYKMEPQSVMTMQILEGTDGHKKMSKSLGNYIALFDEPNDMFGKIMSIPDEIMLKYYEVMTDEDLEEMNKFIKEDPRNAKVNLAKIIVSWLHNEDAAEKAYQDFIQKFVNKENPHEMEEYFVGNSEIGILDLISKVTNFAPSNSEARRLVQNNAVTLNGEKIINPNYIVNINGEIVLKVGKKKFGKILLK